MNPLTVRPSRSCTLLWTLILSLLFLLASAHSAADTAVDTVVDTADETPAKTTKEETTRETAGEETAAECPCAEKDNETVVLEESSPSYEETQEEIKAFLRQPPYIILIVIFVLIFIAMWFVPDLPPHGAKKKGKK